ncbi:Rieske-like [2Fe-2S] domain-containing protein [Skeletonema marinoi]|uniref:Rieske-like [2Fe-2S] domain-containing protein n=1 Tax=Skeletonema marinoi TaxID=267567 RepID=A0AAD8YKS9_9STRA|nr:Rieske-like [2Fe-2S] domain-containing protein [Skeletonema marinoi]
MLLSRSSVLITSSSPLHNNSCSSHFIYNFKMKLAVIATLAAGASAFAPTAQVSRSTALTPRRLAPSFNTCHASPPMTFPPPEVPPLELPVVLPSVSPLTRRDPFSLLEISAPLSTSPFLSVRLWEEPSLTPFLEPSST